jgi:hypothetical protein
LVLDYLGRWCFSGRLRNFSFSVTGSVTGCIAYSTFHGRARNTFPNNARYAA